jgi:hypothetical protein
MKSKACSFFHQWALLLRYLVVLSFGIPPSQSLALPREASSSFSSFEPTLHRPPALVSDGWSAAKVALQSTECCVVSVSGLESQLRTLQKELADHGPGDLDLRARLRVAAPSSRRDCQRVQRSVVAFDRINDDDDALTGNEEHEKDPDEPCTVALEVLVRGMASLAAGPGVDTSTTDVLIRIVCASNYRARDPLFHTDKAPLRGYVTLRGVGTEFMKRPCTPLEYAALRSLGQGGAPAKDLRRADELEFIVMKGDHYEHASSSGSSSVFQRPAWLTKVWKRAFACVHRSPPGATTGRRVILSFDLADGHDDREWYQVNHKRAWRSGMTQRKSHLVA